MKSDLRIGEAATTDEAADRAVEKGDQRAAVKSRFEEAEKIRVALLTGGADRPYAYGLATQLISMGIGFDFIGSDELDCPELHGKAGVNFLNLRGEQDPDSSFKRKVWRVLAYYVRLIHYVFVSKAKLFHILWNNKFETFDRTLLMFFYRFLGKKIVLTVHNVNAAERDSRDTFLNRLTLRVQYNLADHLFVHSDKMKSELIRQFGVRDVRATVIPFGINNAVSITDLTGSAARERLGFRNSEKLILFFGNIAPYKGLEYLVAACQKFLTDHSDYRLIIAGRPKGSPQYWKEIAQQIHEYVQKGKIFVRSDYIPDSETEVFFKAADVLVLPYRYIYQSGVLFLGYSFGLPVLVADVGPLKEEVVEGKTGYVFKPEDPVDLAKAIETYFASDLYKDLSTRRREIRDYATQQHSWDAIGERTMKIYATLLGLQSSGGLAHRKTANAS